MDRPHPIRRFSMLLVPTLVACVAFMPRVVAAAGTDSAEGKASADAVASGLQRIQDIAASSAKAVGKDDAKAEQLQAGIEPVWDKIESTVKANDSAAYAALEDNFTLLKIAAKGADASKAAAATDSLSTAAKDYLAKHPGNAGAAIPLAISGGRGLVRRHGGGCRQHEPGQPSPHGIGAGRPERLRGTGSDCRGPGPRRRRPAEDGARPLIRRWRSRPAIRRPERRRLPTGHRSRCPGSRRSPCTPPARRRSPRDRRCVRSSGRRVRPAPTAAGPPHRPGRVAKIVRKSSLLEIVHDVVHVLESKAASVHRCSANASTANAELDARLAAHALEQPSDLGW